ncbi:hypothetical protein ScPMuIL_004683 [Solemya velum]
MSWSTSNNQENVGSQRVLEEQTTDPQSDGQQSPHHSSIHVNTPQQTPPDKRHHIQTTRWEMDFTNENTVEPDVEVRSLPVESKLRRPNAVGKPLQKESNVETTLSEKNAQPSPVPIQRELSDAYIESISRTPRYGSGRFRNYDEMLDDMQGADPFHGSYMPSGKKSHSHTSRKTTKMKEVEEPKVSLSEGVPLKSIRHSNDGSAQKKNRKKTRTSRSASDNVNSNATYTLRKHNYLNSSYEHDTIESKSRLHDHEDFEKMSVKSDDTFTINPSQGDNDPTQSTQSTKRKQPVTRYSSNLSGWTKGDNSGPDCQGLAKFIKDHSIKQRECKHFVLARDKSSVCKCGRDIIWHQKRGLDTRHSNTNRRTEESWSLDKHTVAIACRSFGEIKFEGYGYDTKNSPYIRVCPNTNIELVWDILTTYWKLPVPKLLISVTGGAKRFDLKPRLKTIFKRGLVNAATSTGAWVITGGTATGVMELVGEAVMEHNITTGNQGNSVVAIGVVTWGIVENRVNLQGDKDLGLFPAFYSSENLDNECDDKNSTEKNSPLDHNHTNFILVDDGTENKFGREILFRAELEHFIASRVETVVAENQSVSVPVVLMVVEGGPNTMKTVMESVRRGIPVLVMDGSGRAADFIAEGFRQSQSETEEESEFSAHFHKVMSQLAKKIFEWKTGDKVNEKVQKCIQQLKQSLEKRKLINIYNLHREDGSDTDRAILYALLKANRSIMDQLALSLAMNKCDIAREDIFIAANRMHWKKLNLYHAMFTALVQDRVDFVQLFIENGVDLRDFLTKETLWNLYANVCFEDGQVTFLCCKIYRF